MSKGKKGAMMTVSGAPAHLVSAFSGPMSDRLRFAVMLLLLFTCMIGGGASRPDVLSLLYLRPVAILCIGALFLIPGKLNLRDVRVPLILLAALTATIAIQLIPLPPGLWLSLPGHERYAAAAVAAGMDQPWRPISLAPDLTWNSLVAVVPPLAALLGFAALREDQRVALLPLLIGLACASALMGMVQMGGGASSPAYFYAVHHEGSAVGFFANRNHEAVLLALAFPMLRAWSLAALPGTSKRRFRVAAGVAIGLFMIPMILVTGSRAGIVMGLVGIVCAAVMVPIRTPDRRVGGRWRVASVAAMWVIPIMLAAAAVLLGRALSIERLVTTDVFQEELRLVHLPLMLRMTTDFFPFGIGFGAFDPVFRGFEPDSALAPLYFNRAHNDPLELVLTGGLPAALVALAFLIWWGRRTVDAVLPFRNRSYRTLLARLGAIMIMILFLASFVDYPLRTPLLSVVFAIACGWLSSGRATPSRSVATEGVQSQQVALP